MASDSVSRRKHQPGQALLSVIMRRGFVNFIFLHAPWPSHQPDRKRPTPQRGTVAHSTHVDHTTSTPPLHIRFDPDQVFENLLEINEVGLKDHVYWGMLLLVTLLHGPGKLSLDHILCRYWKR